MSDFQAAQYAWQVGKMREEEGNTVTFGGVNYAVTTAPVSGTTVGLDKLPTEAVGQFVATADPRVFRFNPSHFAPLTSIPAPVPGGTVVWQGSEYQITRVSIEAMRQTVHTLAVFGYKLNWLNDQIRASGDTTLINGATIDWNGIPLRAFWVMAGSTSTQPYTHPEEWVPPTYFVTFPGNVLGAPFNITWGTELTWMRTGFKAVVRDIDTPGGNDQTDLVICAAQIVIRK